MTYYGTQADEWRREVANVTCPLCGAKPGDSCRIVTGRSKGTLTNSPHMGRLDLARRLARKKSS